MSSKKMCMQRTCRVQTTVTGAKLAASEGKLHAGLRSNGFWRQQNCARKKGEDKGKLKAQQNKGKVPVTSAIILDVLCMLIILITGSCALLQSSHLSSQKAVAK